MTKPLLELRGLSGGYPPVSVFRDVSLSVKQGEHVGLFGPNGHGKTTLLKTIAGVLDPWDGGIYFEGKRLNAVGKMQARVSHNLNYDLFRKRRINALDVVDAGLIYVMQGNLLFPEMTVEEVLDIAPRAARNRPGVAQMRRQIHDLFPRLRERWTSKIRYLSGGERQMVSIAVGLLAMPRLLMLDEPTAGVSPIVMDELFDRILEVAKTGIAILMVEQNARQALNIADKGYVLVQGRNRFTDTGEALLANPEVRKSFLGG